MEKGINLFPLPPHDLYGLGSTGEQSAFSSLH